MAIEQLTPRPALRNQHIVLHKQLMCMTRDKCWRNIPIHLRAEDISPGVGYILSTHGGHRGGCIFNLSPHVLVSEFMFRMFPLRWSLDGKAGLQFHLR